jgi:hypothetical protein
LGLLQIKGKSRKYNLNEKPQAGNLLATFAKLLILQQKQGGQRPAG